MTFNRVILVGRLARAPELQYTSKGTPMVRFNLAVSRPKQDEADFFVIRAFGKLAEVVDDYLTKGKLILVEGFLQSRRWQDDGGGWHSIVEVVARNVTFLEKKGQAKPAPQKVAPPEPIPEDDEPPF